MVEVLALFNTARNCSIFTFMMVQSQILLRVYFLETTNLLMNKVGLKRIPFVLPIALLNFRLEEFEITLQQKSEKYKYKL